MNDFLRTLTPAIDFGAMSISLWLAFYLFGKGFPNKIAMRAVVVFLSLAVFFFLAYHGLYNTAPWTITLRAATIVLTLATWYSLTYQMILARATQRLQFYKWAVYALALAAVIALNAPQGFIAGNNNILDVARMKLNWPYAFYGLFLALAGGGILYNLLSGARVGLQRQGRYFLVASLFAFSGAIYGAVALAWLSLPRVVLDGFALASVILLGIAVARNQILIERRVSLIDVPLSAVTILGLAGLYAFITWKAGYAPHLVAIVMAVAIGTHSLLDLAREFLERIRLRRELSLRRRFHQLEDSRLTTLSFRLKVSLGLLCEALRAPGGFIAVRQGDEFIVVAALHTIVALNDALAPARVACEDILQITDGRFPDIALIAPAFEGLTQVAVIGISKAPTRLNYSAGDLDLLSEVADQVGTLVSLSNTHTEKMDELTPPLAATEAQAAELHNSADEVVLTITSNPDPEFVKIVEEALRHLADYIFLGGSPLAKHLKPEGESHVERGKQVSQTLLSGIETLRPNGPRPPEPLPRVWYNYAVLHDAYVEGVPNREITARLYVSEGTFHRTRRNALRGLARLLLEKSRITEE